MEDFLFLPPSFLFFPSHPSIIHPSEGSRSNESTVLGTVGDTDLTPSLAGTQVFGWESRVIQQKRGARVRLGEALNASSVSQGSQKPCAAEHKSEPVLSSFLCWWKGPVSRTGRYGSCCPTCNWALEMCLVWWGSEFLVPFSWKLVAMEMDSVERELFQTLSYREAVERAVSPETFLYSRSSSY